MPGIIEDAGGPAAVLLCDADGPLTDAVRRVLTEHGIEGVAVTPRWPAALEAVVHLSADVAVVDMALTGRAGVRLVGALRALAPDCLVVTISPLRAIDVASLEAGAVEVVDPADLRPLARVAGRVVRGAVHP